MSMLAERKQKTSWILDPRQNDWSKDSNKFGQKMLEKMGWTPGKGLGASEQGMTEALRVKYKSDMKGLGCKDPKYEWLKQQQEFDNLLSTFHTQESKEDEQKRISLEEKSKQTKTRVFYHKSIKGKDITRYSEKDLQCIIGFANKNQPSENEDVKEEITEPSCDIEKTKKENEEVSVTSKVDLKKKKNKNKKILLEAQEPTEPSGEVELNISSDIEKAKKENEEVSEVTSEDVDLKKKKKKKKKNLHEAQEPSEPSREVELNISSDVKIKKKKRKTVEIEDSTEIEAPQVLDKNNDLAVPKKKRRKNKE